MSHTVRTLKLRNSIMTTNIAWTLWRKNRGPLPGHTLSYYTHAGSEAGTPSQIMVRNQSVHFDYGHVRLLLITLNRKAI